VLGAVASVLGVVVSEVDAHAAEPTRLEWVRLEGAGSCIDSAELEARVKRRLGNDPFDPRAARSIEGVARRTSGVWHAQIAVRSYAGEANPPLRELESRAEDCDSLSNAVVLAVALAVDPSASLTDAPPKEIPPPPPVEAPKAPPPAPAVAPPTGLDGRAEASAVAQMGLLPRASVGVGLGTAVAVSARLDIALRAAVFPGVQMTGDPSYSVGLFALDLELCAVALRTPGAEVRACAGPGAGILHAAVLTGDRAQPGERASFAAAIGLDAAVFVARSVAFDLGVRAAAPVNRYRFTLDGSSQPLFEQSAVAGMGYAGLELRFGRP
jgi:hypothetical protein